MASGTVTKRDGRWRARYRHPERGTQHQATFEKKVDAQRWLRDELSKLDHGTWIESAAGTMTFEAYFHAWSSRQVWTSTTHTAMSLAVRMTPFRGTALRSIKTTHIEAWIKEMTTGSSRQRALAPGTIKTRYVNVRSVFRAAVRDRELAVDPTEGVRLPRQRKRSEALRIPTPEQVALAMTSADERFRAFIGVCSLAGLRLGEAAALQFGDLDVERQQLHVRRQVQRAGRKEVEIRLPKYASERTVPIPEELAHLLTAHRELGHQTEWLFAGPADNPPHQNTVGYHWRRTLARAGLSGIRIHDLRHFYASGLIAAGCDVVTVQRALGHAKASTTLDTYAKLWPSGEARTRAAASALAQQVLATNVGEMWAKRP
ncbi:tyrosine-type recombinase/integrase [Nocardioides zeae]